MFNLNIADHAPLIPEAIGDYRFVSCLSTHCTPHTSLYKHYISQQLYAIKMIPKSQFPNSSSSSFSSSSSPNLSVSSTSSSSFSIIPQSMSNFSSCSVISPLNEFQNELCKIREINHPNIVEIFDVFEEGNFVFIVMEYCQNGNLFSFIRKHGKFSESAARVLFTQLLDVIKSIHSNSIIHHDIRPENILLDQQYKIKVSNFGSRYIMPKNDISSSSESFDPSMAELLSSNSYEDGVARDMWSCGVVLYFILSGCLPFENDKDILDAVNSSSVFSKASNCLYFYDDMSEHVCDLLSQLLVVDTTTSMRVTVDTIVRHPWVLNKFGMVKKDNVTFILSSNNTRKNVDKISRSAQNFALPKAISADIRPLITIPEVNTQISVSKTILNRNKPRKSLQYQRKNVFI